MQRAFGNQGYAAPRQGHDFSRIPVHSLLALRTAPDAAEAQADAIAGRVAVPGPAPNGRLPSGLSERLAHEVGCDFSRVRVHSDVAAADRVANHGAEAMSEGRDLYFAADRWRPDTREGAFLAAHEAVHAAQQSFAEHGAGRYFKKDPPAKKDAPPQANAADIFDEIVKRAPDLAVFVNARTISDAISGKPAEGPTVSGGTSGTDVHEWHVILSNSPVTTFSQTASKPIVTQTKTNKGQIVKHVIPIVWGTFSPFGSGTDYETQAADAEKAKQLPKHAKRAKDFAFELKVAEPLIHELLHARIIMETDPTFTAGSHTPLVQGYIDIIAASQSSGVKKERDAVRSQIGFLASGHERKPTAAEFAAVIDTNDEFLVHEKYDSQKVFGLMGRSGATNQAVAKAYSKVVARGLTIKFGDTTVSDQMAETQRQKLETLTIAYYDKIDAAMAAPAAAPHAPTTPAPAAPTTPAPATTAPAKAPKK